MFNPKDVFTEDGFEEYKAHLRNLDNALFYITNMADDLHLGSEDESEKVLLAIYELQRAIESKILLNGTGETRED